MILEFTTKNVLTSFMHAPNEKKTKTKKQKTNIADAFV
jgi:hypothetical protein